jgi:outer membrane protein OmpA-like peptidoglycan-associated protein/tetratricopeptide (TPR) repeat protein
MSFVLKHILAALSFSLFFLTNGNSQELPRKEFARAVQNADVSFYYDGDYEKAAEGYKKLLDIYPENCNLAAKLGICYLNIDGMKEEALELLKKASKNIVETEREYIEYGEKAPLDTYLYLPVAYHRNDSLEKALTLFTEARKRLANTELFREDFIANQIRDCRYAIEMKKKPLTIIADLFVPWLAEYPGATNPVISKNDSLFVFTQKTGKKTRILCSYKAGGHWQKPRDITRKLGGYDRLYTNSISGKGDLLVLFLDDGGDGNLYMSQRRDTAWTRIKGFGKNINSIYWEAHGNISPDGNTLLFSSNRPGGQGELDIWASERLNENEWDKPVNLGDVINTPFNEDSPFFDEKNNALIFSSAGHISMGGYDVFRSVKRNNLWTNPVGMPYSFNTTTDNTFFIVPNNAPGFITSFFDYKSDARNIYSMVAIDPADEITVAEGKIILTDGMQFEHGQAGLKLIDIKQKGSEQSVIVTDAGEFRFEIKPGEYQLLVSYEGYKTDTVNISLPLYFLSHYMALQSDLVPLKVVSGDFLTIQNILFDFNSAELNEEASVILKKLKEILLTYPSLKIEVAGYTDSKGSRDYNKTLAMKRVRAVIDYFVGESIPAERFTMKAFGESNFVAINTNPDGTDNPEGRSLNRRVAFGIVDPGSGIVLRQDTYTPQHLRLPSSVKYNVILSRSREKLPDGTFDTLKLDGMKFIRSFETDTISLYAVGVFYSRAEALRYLDYSKKIGFTDAYVSTSYELNEELASISKLLPVVSSVKGKKTWTIQVRASKIPLNTRRFKIAQELTEILGEDGYYRYVTGEYPDLATAKEAIKKIKEMGYKDAFIRELDILTGKINVK